jgi:predicted  nucleic acid-binding Zn-ribbon protein
LKTKLSDAKSELNHLNDQNKSLRQKSGNRFESLQTDYDELRRQFGELNNDLETLENEKTKLRRTQKRNTKIC